MRIRTITIAVLLGLVGAARGAITVTDELGVPLTQGVHYDISNVGNDYTIEILAHHEASGSSEYEITGTGGENIVLLDITETTDSDANSQLIISVLSTASGINDLDEVRQSTEAVILTEVVIKGDIGEITVDAIGDIDCDGDVVGPVESTGTNFTGKISTIDAGGDILGDITSAGLIGYLTAETGDIGTSLTAVAIEATTITGRIDGNNIYADITTTTGDLSWVIADTGVFEGSVDAAGNIRRGVSSTGGVESTTDMDATIDATDLREQLDVDGDFLADSALTVGRLNVDGEVLIDGDCAGDLTFTNKTLSGNDITIGGDLSGTITVNNDLEGDITVNTFLESYVKIGDNLEGDITVDEDDGLTGQIIINADAASGTWTGTVTVGDSGGTTYSLTTHEYTTTAADLGGGAVGLVPFSTHRESCDPVHGATVLGKPLTATIQFYGPVVQDDIGSDMPVRIYRGDFGAGTNETEITSGFTVSMHPGGDLKKIKIEEDSETFKPRYRYRIDPITSGAGSGETLLLCDELLTGSDVVVSGRDYWFDVDLQIAMSVLDLSENGWVDADDLIEWAYDPQDFDENGQADAADLVLIADHLGEQVD